MYEIADPKAQGPDVRSPSALLLAACRRAFFEGIINSIISKKYWVSCLRQNMAVSVQNYLDGQNWPS